MRHKQFPADAIERSIYELSVAESFLSAYASDLMEFARERRDSFIREFGENYQSFANKGYAASVISVARVLARHGSVAGDHYNYHDELHSLDLITHLRELYHSDHKFTLSPEEWMYLAIFANAHDLRQNETGYSEDGVGNNELASADETARILADVGFDPEYQQPMFQLLRWMIHGTTFLPTTMEFGDVIIGPGAIAPFIAERIREEGHSVGELTADEAAELVLLAADIDTANVAQSIDQFTIRSGHLCRELHKMEGHASLSHETAPSVLEFLTKGQERYFFALQRFNSQMARSAFEQGKERTGKQLKELTQWAKNEFRDQLGDSEHSPSGEKILRSYLAKARLLAAADASL